MLIILQVEYCWQKSLSHWLFALFWPYNNLNSSFCMFYLSLKFILIHFGQLHDSSNTLNLVCSGIYKYNEEYKNPPNFLHTKYNAFTESWK